MKVLLSANIIYAVSSGLVEQFFSAPVKIFFGQRRLPPRTIVARTPQYLMLTADLPQLIVNISRTLDDDMNVAGLGDGRYS